MRSRIFDFFAFDIVRKSPSRAEELEFFACQIVGQSHLRWQNSIWSFLCFPDRQFSQFYLCSSVATIRGDYSDDHEWPLWRSGVTSLLILQWNKQEMSIIFVQRARHRGSTEKLSCSVRCGQVAAVTTSGFGLKSPSCACILLCWEWTNAGILLEEFEFSVQTSWFHGVSQSMPCFSNAVPAEWWDGSLFPCECGKGCSRR